MTKKQYLKQGYKLKQEIKSLEQTLEELESNLDDVKAIQYSKDKLEGGPLQDDTNIIEKIDKIIEVENIIKDKLLELKTFQANLILEILKLNNTDEKNLLQARYIFNETWEEIAKRFCFSLSYIYAIHNRALKNFKIPENSSKK